MSVSSLVFVCSLQAWKTDTFATVLQRDLRLYAEQLPLQHASHNGGYIQAGELSSTVLHTREDAQILRIKVGVFFTEIVANCGCGDEPIIKDAYCELCISIDKITARAQIQVIANGSRDSI